MYQERLQERGQEPDRDEQNPDPEHQSRLREVHARRCGERLTPGAPVR
jgi:hypothetical protein